MEITRLHLHMKKLFTLALVLFGLQLSFAQTQEDFDDAGKRLLHMITDSVIVDEVPWIRKREYFEVIDKQPISDYQKTVLKEKLNANFGRDINTMMNKFQGLRDSYELERKEGATFEYYETIYELMDNSVDTYAVKTTYIYRNGKVQTLVSFEYELAWIEDHFSLISEVKENF